jgi:hypothetical protein
MGTNINTRKFLSRRYSGIYILTGVSYNPDYLLVKNAIESTGVTLTSTQNNAGNTLVNQLQSYNIWGKQKTLYGILGGTAGAHKWNWKNPLDTNAAFRLTFSTGWTHSSTGMTPNGTSAYANTYLIPSTGLSSINNSGFSFYSRTNQSYTNSPNHGVIASTTNDRLYWYPQNPSGFQNGFESGLTYAASFSCPDRKGFYTGSRTASNVRKAYRNGILQATNTLNDTTGILNSTTYFTIAAANGPYLASTYTKDELAFFGLHDGLTDTEAANFYTAVQNYNTTLGRQV